MSIDEINRAITILEDYGCPAATIEAHEALVSAVGMAIAALREKQAREKGCRYCTDASFRQRGYYIDDERQGKIMGIDHFCINCGRKMEGEVK